MTIAPYPLEIRQIVFRTLQSLGAKIESPFQVRETILTQGGQCLARTYLADGYKAVWLLEEGVLQFSDESGRLVQTVNLFEEMTPQRMAA
jgi:hypothetical protein